MQFFNEASLASLPANLVAVPLTGFVILPLIFLDLFIPGDVLWYLAAEVLTQCFSFFCVGYPIFRLPLCKQMRRGGFLRLHARAGRGC